jgi:hypothetical protein
MATGRHWHVASLEEKRMAVAMQGGPARHKRGRKAHTPDPALDLALPFHPSTLRRWRQQSRKAGRVLAPLPRGHRRTALSDGEKRVVGGYVLSKWDDHALISVDSIAAFVLGSWDQSISHGAIVALMQELNLPSHEVEEKELKYWNPNLANELHGFIHEVRASLRGGLRRSALCAVDVCYWSDSGHRLRTYGPAGRSDSSTSERSLKFLFQRCHLDACDSLQLRRLVVLYACC